MTEQKTQARSFEDLHAWQACRDTRLLVSRLAKRLPRDEKYRLADQMIRSSRATTALIAEGYGRFHFKENIQCCRQSRGELYELLDHLIVAKDEAYIDESAYGEARQLTIRAIELVNGYIRFLQRQDAQETRRSAEANGRHKKVSPMEGRLP